MKGFSYSMQVSFMYNTTRNNMYFYDYNVMKYVLDNAVTRTLYDGRVVKIIECNFDDIFNRNEDNPMLHEFEILEGILLMSGGGAALVLENNLLRYLDAGQKENVVFIDAKDDIDEKLVNFILDHELTHIINNDRNLGITASIKPEIMADQRAFEKAGIIDGHGRGDVDAICDMYNDFLKWSTANCERHYRIMKKKFLENSDNKLVKKILSKDVSANVITDILGRSLARRANGLKFVGRDDIKFVFKDGKISWVKCKINCKTKKIIATTAAGVLAAGAGAVLVASKLKGKS
jgi:hypothetical protein